MVPKTCGAGAKTAILGQILAFSQHHHLPKSTHIKLSYKLLVMLTVFKSVGSLGANKAGHDNSPIFHRHMSLIKRDQQPITWAIKVARFWDNTGTWFFKGLNVSIQSLAIFFTKSTKAQSHVAAGWAKSAIGNPLSPENPGFSFWIQIT